MDIVAVSAVFTAGLALTSDDDGLIPNESCQEMDRRSSVIISSQGNNYCSTKQHVDELFGGGKEKHQKTSELSARPVTNCAGGKGLDFHQA